MAIYKREGSEFYTYEFYFNGKRVRKCTDQTNKDVARDLMAVHRTRLAKGEAGIVEPNAAPLFKTFAADWLKGIKLKKCRNTHRCYADGVRALGEHFNGFTLDKIVAERIEEFRNKRLSEGLHNAGVNRNLAVLRLVLRAAVKLGKLPRSPFGDGNVKLEKEKGFERILSYVEEEKYLAKANPKLKDIAVMMLECGLRPDEVFRIQKNEVDLRKRHLHVTDGKTGQRDVFRLLAARRDWYALGELDGESGWDAEAWQEALAPYFAEHDQIGADANARGPHLLKIDEGTERWTVRQVIDDPAGDHDWGISGEIDLAESDEAGIAVLRVTDVGTTTSGWS